MNASTAISRDVALRIGLAARVLPGVGLPRLLEVLREKLGASLSIESLKIITVTDLKTGLGSLDGEEDAEEMNISMEEFKLAVRYLWGEEDVVPDLPDILPYNEGEMPGSIRVALASNTADDLNGHFGSCPRFLVYQVSSSEIRLVSIRSTVGADESDDRNAFRANLIDDCHVLYVQSVGGPAAAKVVRAGIYPLKIAEGGKALEILQQLQSVMGGNPPPWLAKILGVPAEQRTKYKAEAAG
jgi:nitrogen fixation protein NifX